VTERAAVAGSGPVSRLSRRRFLCGLGAGAGGLVLGSALSSCSPSGQAAVPPPGSPRDLSVTERVVRFANWQQYIDTSPDGSRYPTLEEFTRQTGIRVDYSAPILSNEQLAGQLGLSLAMGHDPGFDVVVLTDWMVAQLTALGWVQPLSTGALPHASRRLLPGLRDKPLPGVLAYSVPWQGSFTGIAWNAKLTGRPVTGIMDLLNSPDLHGKVGLVAEMRDVMGLLLLDLGYEPEQVTDTQFNAALSRVDAAFRSGQVKTVSDNVYLDMVAGKLAAAVAWPGDITYYQPTHPELGFALPSAGWMLYTDNMMIPAYAAHRENAERLMDFYYQPDIAAQLTESQEYLCPVSGTQPVLRRSNPVLARDPYIFPPATLMEQAHVFRQLTTAQDQDYTSRYAATVGL
jgi:spermidine/putrescine transport system substrate-binding protein